MKTFSFRLDSILRYREYLEKKAMKNLFDARYEYQGLEREIERLAKKRSDTAGKCVDEGREGMDVSKYQAYLLYRQKLNHDLNEAGKRLAGADEKIKARKNMLKKESIKKKTLELFKDLQLEKYLKRVEKEEQKFLDDLVVVRRGGKK